MKIAILGSGVMAAASEIVRRLKGHDVVIRERRTATQTLGRTSPFGEKSHSFWSDSAYLMTSRPFRTVRPQCAACRVQPTTERAGHIGLINQRMGYPSRLIMRSDFQRVLLAPLLTGLVYMKAAISCSTLTPWIVGAGATVSASCPSHATRRIRLAPPAQFTSGARNSDDYRDGLQRIFADRPEPVATHNRPRACRAHQQHLCARPRADLAQVQLGPRRRIGTRGTARVGPGRVPSAGRRWASGELHRGAADWPGSSPGSYTAFRFQKTAGITLAGHALPASLFNRNDAFCREGDRASQRVNSDELALGMTDG
jgi:hypothetical protein